MAAPASQRVAKANRRARSGQKVEPERHPRCRTPHNDGLAGGPPRERNSRFRSLVLPFRRGYARRRSSKLAVNACVHIHEGIPLIDRPKIGDLEGERLQSGPPASAGGSSRRFPDRSHHRPGTPLTIVGVRNFRHRPDWIPGVSTRTVIGPTTVSFETFLRRAAIVSFPPPRVERTPRDL